MRLLITGTGRCGTWWFTHALRSCGVDAQHEVAFSMDRHGEGDWTCEVSWLAAPFTPLDGVHVVHLVRHPLPTIGSRAAWGSFSDRKPDRSYDPRVKGRWAMHMCPEIREGATPVERAAIHWVRWNEQVVADEVLRLEDVTADDVARLARIVDPQAGTPVMGPPVNGSISPPQVTWDQVEHVPGLMAMAERFGYYP